MGKWTAKLKQLVTKFKGSPKSTQSKAFVRILQFFAIMLVLTIFAKGAAGVTMPRVTALTPFSAEISETISATGNVSAQGTVDIELPVGLTVSRVNAQQGANVKEGDTLMEFDEDALREELILQQAALSELRLQLRELQLYDGLDTSMVDDAQEAVDSANRAYMDAADAANHAASELSPAKEAFDAALQTDDEELRAATWAQLDYWQQQYDMLIVDRDTKYDLLEIARKTLRSAQEALDKQRDQEAIDAERNNIAITKKRLEIEKQQEMVDTLVAAQAAGGALTSPVAGTVAEVNLVAGDTTAETSRLRISTSEEGYVVEIPVSQADAAKLQAGGMVYVKRSGMYYSEEATITAKYYSAEQNSMMIRATLPGTGWTVGESVEANVVISRQQHYSCVPISAVHSDSAGSFVYILEERNTVLGTQMVAIRESVEVLGQDTANVAIQTTTVSTYDILVLTGSSRPINAGDRVRIEDKVNSL